MNSPIILHSVTKTKIKLKLNIDNSFNVNLKDLHDKIEEEVIEF